MAERLELGSKAEHLLDLALRAAATGGPQIPPASPPARPDTSTMQMPFERPHRACSRPNIFWTAHSMRRHMATSQRHRGLQLTPRSTSSTQKLSSEPSSAGRSATRPALGVSGIPASRPCF